eukprot:gene14159-16687_t
MDDINDFEIKSCNIRDHINKFVYNHGVEKEFNDLSSRLLMTFGGCGSNTSRFGKSRFEKPKIWFEPSLGPQCSGIKVLNIASSSL